MKQPIGQKLRDRRLELGMTITSLSEKSGLAVGTVWNVENGIGDTQVSTLQKIAEALGVDIKLNDLNL